MDAQEKKGFDNPKRKLYRIAEYAVMTGLSVSALRRLFRLGRIPGFQPFGRRGAILFPPDAIEQAQQVQENKTARPRGPQPKWMNPKNKKKEGK